MAKSIALRCGGPLSLARRAEARVAPALALDPDDLERIKEILIDLEVLKPMHWKVEDGGW